jgi:hypothetical protein
MLKGEGWMKRVLLSLVFVFSLVVVGDAFAAETCKLTPKVGDEVFVCGCGEGCDCYTMSMKPGKCTCGKPMVKGKVTKVGDGVALIKTDKEEREFKTVGQYACACGADCDCGTISQKPGKCACGKAMKKIESTP